MRQHTHGQTAVEGPAERPGAYASCAIRDYLDKKTPKTNYAPYILSGGVVNSKRRQGDHPQKHRHLRSQSAAFRRGAGECILG